jgi:hypothetical protein
MLHILPQPQARQLAYAEAVTRLASIRHALRLVEPFGGGPASDDESIAAAWDDSGDARQRLFDRRSERLVGATAAGLEALLIERQEGREPHEQATEAMVDQIRNDLRRVAGIILA